MMGKNLTILPDRLFPSKSDRCSAVFHQLPGGVMAEMKGLVSLWRVQEI